MQREPSPFTRIIDSIESDWRAIARQEQIQPDGDWWSIWAYIAGRGAGKTRSGAEAIREWVESGRCGRLALIAPTTADARDVVCLLSPQTVIGQSLNHRNGA
jgi:phage terminase large subunit-like protein